MEIYLERLVDWRGCAVLVVVKKAMWQKCEYGVARWSGREKKGVARKICSTLHLCQAVPG